MSARFRVAMSCEARNRKNFTVVVFRRGSHFAFRTCCSLNHLSRQTNLCHTPHETFMHKVCAVIVSTEFFQSEASHPHGKPAHKLKNPCTFAHLQLRKLRFSHLLQSSQLSKIMQILSCASARAIKITANVAPTTVNLMMTNKVLISARSVLDYSMLMINEVQYQ